MTRLCGATRPALRDAGRECTGRDLIVVTWMHGDTLPVVLPARALDVIEPESWWATPIERFAGGDHAHLCVPRQPSSFDGDVLFLWGDVAEPWQFVGHVDGGQMWMGAPS